ncbi:hypothetical protein JCM5353_006779 [Sporobolomyces roseus]
MSRKDLPILDDFPRLKHLELVDLPLVEEEAARPSPPKSDLDGYVETYLHPQTQKQEGSREEEAERKKAVEGDKEKEAKEKKEKEAKAFVEAIVSKRRLEFLEVRQTQLRKKVVHGYGPPVLPRNWIDLTWPQLKQISLSGPQIGQSDLDFVAMFEGSLETLVIRQTMHREDTPSLPHLPHLRSLTIATSHPSELCRFLRLSPRTDSDGHTPMIEDPLHYPLLSSLSLDGVPDSPAFEPVSSFILSHSSTLRSLDCFQPNDPLDSSSIASCLDHASLSNVHIRTSAYPANSFPNDAFKIAQPAFNDSDGSDDEASPILREPTVDELEKMINQALSYGERRLEEATRLYEEDEKVKELFALAGLYKDLDADRVAKFV